MSSAVCAHCGLPAPEAVSQDAVSFCCQGCRGAYQLIRQWGLDDFYSLSRGTTGNSVDAMKESAAPLDDLDQPTLLGRSAPLPIVTPEGKRLLRTRLQISGLHCAACTWLLERAPDRVEGWLSSRVSMHDRTIEIIFDPETIRLSQIALVLQRLGYTVSALGTASHGQEADDDEAKKLLVDIAVAGFCGANAMWIAIALYAGEFTGMLAEHTQLLRAGGVLLGVIAVAFPGRRFFRSALASMRTRTPHMDLPVSVGLAAGAAGSVYGLFNSAAEVYFDSIAALVFFLLIGRWVQMKQQRRASARVEDLLQLAPTIATRVAEDGTTSRISVDRLKVGDTVRVAAGESFPIDGVVVAGDSSIDRSLLTGESFPVDVGVGSEVEAGTDNLQGRLEIRSTAVAADTRLAKLTQSVSEAAASRTPVVQMANRIGGWFVVVVMLLAVATVAYRWPTGPMEAMQSAVALLIVACPCALALATPLAIAASIGRLAGSRILVRSGDCLERLDRPGTVFFDKTGTLTEGRMHVSHWLGDESLIGVVAAAEQAIRHPIADALLRFAGERGLSEEPLVDGIERIAGAGLRGRLTDGSRVLIGNERLAASGFPGDGDEGAQSDAPWWRESLSLVRSEGSTPILVAIDGDVKAVFGVKDQLREEAMGVVRFFRKAGWTVGILSGDDRATVANVGAKLSIDPEYARGGLSPDEKLAQIKRAGQHGTVIMVGDGLNDSAALAAADIGVAVRNSANASLAAAPVIMGDGRLTGLTQLVLVAHRTRRVVRQNFALSIGYNVGAVALAISGLISPLIAAVLMPISSLTVIFNTTAQLTAGRNRDALSDDRGQRVLAQSHPSNPDSPKTFSHGAGVRLFDRPVTSQELNG